MMMMDRDDRDVCDDNAMIRITVIINFWIAFHQICIFEMLRQIQLYHPLEKSLRKAMLLLIEISKVHVESDRNQIVMPVGLVWTFGNKICITFTIGTSKFG